VSDDARRIAGVANVELPEEVVSPYLFEPPIAPHLAAEIRGVEVRLEVIASAVEHARERADLLVVEGVGGWRVPLSPSLSVSDLPRRLGLPVVLVVGLRLGCINHAVLTAESIVAHGSSLAGWVGSVLDPAQLALRGNIETLLGRLGAPCLGVIPHLRGPDAHALAAAVALPSPAIAGPRGRTREPPGGAR
jgi:dethiobiotin synthetase